ncbi:hypothetical protein CRUP_007208 [Coryphaenoides rupestris]|nr:hypothetical protein CRUP_007208 [Coryphaenoides rupestris]
MPQHQVDVLKGAAHRKHPGVTNMKTLRLPEELQRAALSIVLGAQINGVPDQARSLTQFLWSRKRPVEASTLRQRAIGLERMVLQRAMERNEDIDNSHVKSKVLSELRKTTYHWTALRASHSCWGDTLKEMVCVDSSGPMNILAERLLNDDGEKAQPHIKQVHFRQFLPVSPQVQFDLVVGAFSLSELASKKEREETLVTLWRKTSSYLSQEMKTLDSRTPSVFAPCPHEMTCPKLAQHPPAPCNFNQHYHPLPLPGGPVRGRETFSYMILSRSDPSKAEPARDWVRVVAPVLRRPRHVHCHTCGLDGQLHHMVVTRAKHGRDLYRCARSSDWGDQLPIIQQEEADPE